MSATALTTRSDVQVLTGLSGFRDLLSAEARQGAWRIVELFGQAGAPFEVALSWSAGSGSGAEAQLTVARAARVAIFARSLRVRVANLSSATTRVGVTVADGFAPTRNVYETHGDLTEQTPVSLVLPAFARAIRLELSDPALLPTTVIRVFDGEGTLRGVTVASEQPWEGVPLAGAAKVEIEAATACQYRAIYPLNL